MATRLTLTEVNGTSLPATHFLMDFESGQLAPFTVNLNLRNRTGTSPAIDSVQSAPRDLGFVCWANDSDDTLDDFRAAVLAVLPVDGTAITVKARRDSSDGATEVSITAYVASIHPDSASKAIHGTLRALDPYWQSTTQQTDTTSPTTNAGSLAVVPVITLSNGLSATRNRATITDRTGHGIANYPVRIGYTTSLVAANIVVYVNGLSAPFRYDPTSGALWVRVNCGPNQTTFVDIYHSASLGNTVTANTLDMGGLDIDSATNTVPVWDDWQIEAHPPAAALAWVAGNLPTAMSNSTGTDNTWTWALTSESASGVTFTFALDGSKLANDANLAVLTLPAPAASGAILAASAIWTTLGVHGTPDDYVKLTIWTRQRDQISWELQDSQAISGTTSPQTVNVSADVSGAVQIAVGLLAAVHILGSLTSSATWTVNAATLSGLDSALIPSVVLSADVTAMILDGMLTNSTTGDQIVFDELLMDDVALTLDVNSDGIQAASGPWYAANIAFNNSAKWFTLAAGANAWTFSGTADVSLAWHEKQAF